MNENEAIACVFVFASIAAVLITALQAWGRRSSGGAKAPQLESVEKRLARLEVAIDDLTSEIGRMSEGQHLVTKLLVDRSRELPEESRVAR
jgi:hypothetical protein